MEPLADDERLKLNTEELDHRMYLYRQPSGCLDIGQDGDIVHICSGSIEQFIAKLQAFVDRTPV